MKLREMLEDCFSNKPDQIAWRMAADDCDYEIVSFPEYMTKFVPGGVVYITDCEIKDWRWDVRNCRLYVDLCEEGKPSSVVEDTQEDHEDEEEEEKGTWTIEAKLLNGDEVSHKYRDTTYSEAVDYYNRMVKLLNDGKTFVGFPDDEDDDTGLVMQASQILYVVFNAVYKE